MSGLINKAKEVLHSNKGDNPQSSNTGPHSNAGLNKADPRIDSDRDHRNDPTSAYGSTTGGGTYTGNTTTGSTNAGPHSSNLANKLDPRVDSDVDNRNNPASRVGGYGTQENYGLSGANPAPGTTGTTGTYGSGTTTAGSGLGGHHSTNAGPHSSNLANKLDPRVDSDLDNRNNPASRVGGYGTQENYGVSGVNPVPTGSDQYTAGKTGYTGATGAAGTIGGHGSTTAGSGNAQQTAGPHNSNLANKLDPRVDSDMDGSRTVGQNRTHY